MEQHLGLGKTTRRAYGLDEIALCPTGRTVDPQLVDTSWTIAGIPREIPILASAMDGVVDVGMAVRLTQLGSLGVLNLDGIQTRYADPTLVLEKIANVGKEDFVPLMQHLYSQPIQPELISQRIREIKDQGGIAAVSSVPATAAKYAHLAAEAGSAFYVVQATVVSTHHVSATPPLNLKDFCENLGIPVILGNCVTFEVSLALMRAGAAGVLVGIGPGAACTSRGVLGVGVPQATAIADCAHAREVYTQESGRYVPIIADGGLITGGDVCKSIACGADAVMMGSPIARAAEAPGRGFHWGMATPSPVLPRGTRIRVGTTGTLSEILRGPAKLEDGTHNLLGALQTSMGTLGAQTIPEMQQVPVVIAPSLLTEGKVYQKAQQLGMGK